MNFSNFLNCKKQVCKDLVLELRKEFQYVSILGSDVKSKRIFAQNTTSSIREEMFSQCGFVIKMSNGTAIYEYSLDDIDDNVVELAHKIITQVQVDDSLSSKMITTNAIEDNAHIESFHRDSDVDDYNDETLLSFCKQQQSIIQSKNEHVRNAICVLTITKTSKLFVSEHKVLDQVYAWVNGNLMVVYRDNDKTIQTRENYNSTDVADVMNQLPTHIDRLLEKADHLTKATPVEPGIYDVITHPSISGLIAHEAFGHGVEMDQFVKDRALAKQYINDYVASPIVNMYDGAASCVSAASYFFDDDGVLASSTQIIKDGVLIHGISDLVSALELGTTPTGNGRRESYKRKAYSRMTNTYFGVGKDKLEDMIASVKHGYMLFETDNGMEDPKNWQIQCVASYGIEIVDGKLTDHYISPVVMSGYVPDLLKSISMISDEVKVIGSGSCGKGYKEWVNVSDGGPALKARVKLG